MSIKARAGRTKSLNALINKDTSILGQIFDQATRLKQIETLVLQSLPDEVSSYYRVANFEKGRLLLLTSSAIHLTRFRYLKPQLVAQLKQKLPSLETIELKIRPEAPQAVAEPKGKRLSSNAKEKLRQLADEVDNPRLKEALLRASRPHKKTSD